MRYFLKHLVIYLLIVVRSPCSWVGRLEHRAVLFDKCREPVFRFRLGTPEFQCSGRWHSGLRLMNKKGLLNIIDTLMSTFFIETKYFNILLKFF